MLYYVELSGNEDVVPLEYVIPSDRERRVHEGWVFEGTDGERHSLLFWEDQTGYRVEL